MSTLGRNLAASVLGNTWIALVQIGYWLAFFRMGPSSPVLGVGRELFWINLGFAVPYALGALLLLWLHVIWKAAASGP